MKRDARLHGLSADHHHVLALARRLADHSERGEPLDGAMLQRRLQDELEPHFQVEERALLAALEHAGGAPLATRLADEHEALRALFGRVLAGDAASVVPLANLLTAHVRWEERELFPWCEAQLPPATLDRIGDVAPHVGRNAGSPVLRRSHTPAEEPSAASPPSEPRSRS